MIKHYLKVALRQIGKNKTQYLLSVIGIAVGLLCFSVTSYYMRRYNNQFTAWPNSSRIAKVYVKSASNNYLDYSLPGKELQALIDNPPAGIEKVTYSGDYYSRANITFTGNDGKERYFECSFRNVAPGFIDIYSVLTPEGNKPSLKPGEVLISRSAVTRIFGDENPVGTLLYFSKADTDTVPATYSTISGIIEDQPEGTYNKQDLYFAHTSPIHPDKYYWNAITVLLSEGVSAQEVNKRLQTHTPPFGEKADSHLFVKTLREEMMEPENIAASLLIPIVGALVLLAAMINFLKFCIQSFYNRTRELSLRKSLGSNTRGFFYLLFIEIALLFTVSALLCFMLTEWLTPIAYQYMLSRNIMESKMLIHLPTLFRQEGEYLFLLLILCSLIATGAILRLRNYSLVEGVKGGKGHKSGVRNFMLGVQLFICFLFIGGAVGLNVFHSQLMSSRYNTLTEEECSRIWKMNLWDTQLRGHEEEIMTQIRTLPGVEDIISTLKRTAPTYKTSKDETIRGMRSIVSPNYAGFMKLPIEGRMPVAPNEVAISRSLVWELENDGEKNPSSVLLDDKVYQITGIFEQLPFETVYTKDQITKTNPYERFNMITVPDKTDYNNIYIKCRPDQEQAVRKEILRIVRTQLPETIPYSLSTLKEENTGYDSGAIILSDVFSLLSIISLCITVLGIYSAISLDTRSRQKEVAIRKINGAGPKAIALLFGKLYIRLLVISAIPSLLLVYLFLMMLARNEVALLNRWLNNPLMWLGILLMTSSIVCATVAFRIWKISRLNPAKIIKAE